MRALNSSSGIALKGNPEIRCYIGFLLASFESGLMGNCYLSIRNCGQFRRTQTNNRTNLDTSNTLCQSPFPLPSLVPNFTMSGRFVSTVDGIVWIKEGMGGTG
ncbi:hypothetical protein RRG08_062561 [Elysia crispata]|uniref:Uncharacterized protein n=1 Tax=Elysia crispata TaxID=231223 RepID=A0AAE1AM47_9GAST|nr:hypothetical protein RRG08_062561 [Elysia crispata]